MALSQPRPLRLPAVIILGKAWEGSGVAGAARKPSRQQHGTMSAGSHPARPAHPAASCCKTVLRRPDLTPPPD